MKNHLSSKILLFGLLIVLTGCPGKNDPSPQYTGDCLVKSYSYAEDDLLATDHYEYQNDRIVSIKQTNGYRKRNVTIKYDSQGQTSLIDEGDQRHEMTYKMDAQNRVSMMTVTVSSDQYRYIYHRLYEYTSDGLVSRYVEFLDKPFGLEKYFKGDLNQLFLDFFNLVQSGGLSAQQQAEFVEASDEIIIRRYEYNLQNNSVETHTTPRGSGQSFLSNVAVYDGKKNPYNAPTWQQYNRVTQEFGITELGNLIKSGRSLTSQNGEYRHEYSPDGHVLKAEYFNSNGNTVGMPYSWTYRCK